MTASVAITGQALLHGALDLDAPGADQVAAMLSAADMAFTNLEATVAVADAWITKTKTAHLTTPEGLGSLHALGFAALGHANNHAFDLGPPGIMATHAAAVAQGMAVTGSGADIGQAGAPLLGHRVAVIAADLGPQPDINYATPGRAGIMPLRMRRSVVLPPREYALATEIAASLGDTALQRSRAAVGYREVMPELELFGMPLVEGERISDRWEPDPGDLPAFRTRLAEARLAAEVVVVCFHHHHWRGQWAEPPAWFLDLARETIEQGADVVVAHGVPVLQKISFHRGRPIFCGLGNFIFHTRRPAAYDAQGQDVWSGAVCTCHFAADGSCSGIEVLPVAVGRPSLEEDRLPAAPGVLHEEAADAVLARLTEGLSADDQPLVRLLRP